MHDVVSYPSSVTDCLCREWVLNHARVKIINTFQELKRSRIEAHFAYLECLPCYTVYKHWNGNPPIDHTQLMILKNEISRANDIFKRGLDEDWRRSCMRYPEVLDYYFSLIRFTIPREDDPLMRNPRFGQQKKIVHTRVRSTDRGRRRR